MEPPSLPDRRSPSSVDGRRAADRATPCGLSPQVDHAGWMDVALALACAMQGRVWPNPPVGCVIVRDDRIVGAGFTQFGGRPHAERVALDQAGDRARGATLYVTLEPCCHWGKTPPCADAIVAAGIEAVFVSLQDPDPRVNGGGFQRLRTAGIRVEVGLRANEARKIMAGFFHRVATGRPLLHFGPLPASQTIPDGFDALLWSEPDGMALRIRSSEVGDVLEITDWGSAPAVLDALGHRGLTSVYIPADDPMALALACPGAVVGPNSRHAGALDRCRSASTPFS